MTNDLLLSSNHGLSPSEVHYVAKLCFGYADRRDDDIGVGIRYHTNRKLFNLWRLWAKTKVQEATARYFFFADDCALNASTQFDM